MPDYVVVVTCRLHFMAKGNDVGETDRFVFDHAAHSKRINSLHCAYSAVKIVSTVLAATCRGGLLACYAVCIKYVIGLEPRGLDKFQLSLHYSCSLISTCKWVLSKSLSTMFHIYHIEFILIYSVIFNYPAPHESKLLC